MESQFDREYRIEFFMTKIIQNKFRQDDKVLSKYDIFQETRSVPIDITWER